MPLAALGCMDDKPRCDFSARRVEDRNGCGVHPCVSRAAFGLHRCYDVGHKRYDFRKGVQCRLDSVGKRITRLMTYGLFAFLTVQVRLQFAREHEFANRDTLTGLLNRRAFLNMGSAEVERSKRYAHPMAVVFLDS